MPTLKVSGLTRSSGAVVKQNPLVKQNPTLELGSLISESEIKIALDWDFPPLMTPPGRLSSHSWALLLADPSFFLAFLSFL